MQDLLKSTIISAERGQTTEVWHVSCQDIHRLELKPHFRASATSKWIFKPHQSPSLHTLNLSIFAELCIAQSKFPQSLASAEAEHDQINDSDFPADQSISPISYKYTISFLRGI